MFVVHTVNQLEEAVRVGAEEILVTGGLASNVHEAYLLKSCNGSETSDSDLERRQTENCDIEQVAQRAGVPIWGISSLMIITGEYLLLDSQLNSHSPCMILQRANQH
jgi:hypothetical protein